MYILITILYSKTTATLEGIVFIDVCCVSLNVCGSCPSAIQPVISCGSLSCKGVDHPQSSEISAFPTFLLVAELLCQWPVSDVCSCKLPQIRRWWAEHASEKNIFCSARLQQNFEKTEVPDFACKGFRDPLWRKWSWDRPKEMGVCFVGRRKIWKRKEVGGWNKNGKKLWIHNMEQHGPMVQWSSFQVSGPSRSLAPCGVIGHCILANWRWTTVIVKIHHKQNPSCHV